jgi:hypothetical protein
MRVHTEYKISFIDMTIVKCGILGGGVREVLIELLRSWQLSHKKREEKLNGGRGGGLLAWPTTAASPQITMEIHISNWTQMFQNKTGLDAKANSELYKSNRVCSAGNVDNERCAGILEQSMGARNQVGIGLLYRPTRARICRPFKEPQNRFPAWRAGTTTLFVVPARQAT